MMKSSLFLCNQCHTAVEHLTAAGSFEPGVNHSMPGNSVWQLMFIVQQTVSHSECRVKCCSQTNQEEEDWREDNVVHMHISPSDASMSTMVTTCPGT